VVKIKMINKIITNKTASELPAKNTAASNSKSLAQPSTIKSAVDANVPRSAASMAAAAGLPADRLSSSIVSFARFFSLPLKPQLLADIRRQAAHFVPQPAPVSVPASLPVPGGISAALAAKMREAFLLTAAESKGVELQPKGLEFYTEAVDPDSRRQNEDQQRKRRYREQNEQAEKLSKTESITADNLKKIAFEYAEKNPLVDILNKLPGKNGQRWIVFPFDFVQDDKEFRVSMRILLDNVKGLNRAVCMALDIAIGNEQRQLFVLEYANEKAVRLTVYLMPVANQVDFSQKVHSQIKKELSLLMEIPVERISIKYSEEVFPHEVSCTEQFPLIDEAV